MYSRQREGGYAAPSGSTSTQANHLIIIGRRVCTRSCLDNCDGEPYEKTKTRHDSPAGIPITLKKSRQFYLVLEFTTQTVKLTSDVFEVDSEK